MYLKSLEVSGFKSFGKKCELCFSTPIAAIVGPNGSGKSNLSEAFRFVLGEQSIKSLRGKKGEDLIWNGSPAMPRSNRASVKLVFDNSSRKLNLDFDEVQFERIVHRDGVNEYLLNGSQVRLKDTIELLAGANIGSSGHHIISQGEADRILAASPKERRAMIEDALGLRVYQYKKDESIKKLEKTQENKQQVEALRHENTPHLKFLEKQMRKIERARELRTELVRVYREYLKREELYLKYENERLLGEHEEPERQLALINHQIDDARKKLNDSSSKDQTSNELLSLERQLATVRSEMGESSRALGRLEGQIAYEERRLDEEAKKAREEEGRPVPFASVRSVAQTVRTKAGEANMSDSLDHIKGLMRDTSGTIDALVDQYRLEKTGDAVGRDTIEALLHQKTDQETKLVALRAQEEEHEHHVDALKAHIEQSREASRDLERALFDLMSRQSDIRAVLAKLDAQYTSISRARDDFNREMSEAVALIGRAVSGYADEPLTGGQGGMLSIDDIAREDRVVQEDRRRSLEKMKIRLEELGGAGADEIEREFKEVQERDQFLGREIADLEQSSQTLQSLIVDLEREIDEKFKSGIARISDQFNAFFKLMFGGGSASLVVAVAQKRKKLNTLLGFVKDDHDEEEDEEEGIEEGVDISVSLPNKRVKSLVMLSGGERALTSIALIFAMSQISAPPFIILDETDAALDEANSKRYGDMIETLAKHSQLVLITHNRETMSRAGVLYGVTMGSDGVSKLLSVKFEEAASVAK